MWYVDFHLNFAHFQSPRQGKAKHMMKQYLKQFSHIKKKSFSTALVTLLTCNEGCPMMRRLLDSAEIFTAGLPCPLPASELLALWELPALGLQVPAALKMI